MKTIYTLIAFFLFVGISNSQQRFLTKNGTVSFFSSSPMEDIEAENNQVLSIVDATNGQMAISILMKSFLFEKALMQEHFNENYVESDKFPKATFKGDIINFDAISTSEKKIEVKGKLTIHGITKEVTIHATAKKTIDTIVLNGDFMVNLADFGIEIPAVVKNNIAKEIKVSFNFTHKPYQK